MSRSSLAILLSLMAMPLLFERTTIPSPEICKRLSDVRTIWQGVSSGRGVSVGRKNPKALRSSATPV